MSGASEVLFFFMTLVIVIIIFYCYFDKNIRFDRRDVLFNYGLALAAVGPDTISLQQDDIFNISSRVQNQENQWNSRDNAAYLSIEHINISNQMNKPPYNDAPPSYDEAMKIFVAQSGEASSPTATTPVPTVIVEAPKPSS